MKTKSNKKPRQPTVPPLRFSPTAWAKLLYLRDLGETEVGGFGLTSKDDLLRVGDIRLVRQTCSTVTVEFDDSSVADFYDEQVDSGLRPEQFSRIWIHTHPGDSAAPSRTDEETFQRAFGRSDWSVMFILACGGETYARLQFNQGPMASLELPVELDFSQPFAASDWGHWRAEYDQHVRQDVSQPGQPNWWGEEPLPESPPSDWRDAWHLYNDHEQIERLAYEEFF